MNPWLYVVLLGIAVMVYAIILPNRNTGNDKQTIGEIEQVLDRFLDVMEEDNRELLDTVNGWRRELEADVNRLGGQLDALAQRVDERNQRFDDGTSHPPAPAGEGGDSPRTAAFAPPVGGMAPPADSATVGNETASEAEPALAPGIRGRYPELFAWHDAGKSVEYIAKKSGMNKGEVMLILQLAKREAERGV